MGVTVADTTAVFHLPATAANAGSTAESAAARKETKYEKRSQRFYFVPVAAESHGSLSCKVAVFLKQLGRRITDNTLDPRESSFLFQPLSVALVHFNAVCLLDTFASDTR